VARTVLGASVRTVAKVVSALLVLVLVVVAMSMTAVTVVGHRQHHRRPHVSLSSSLTLAGAYPRPPVAAMGSIGSWLSPVISTVAQMV
jgi:hypothetical protein